MTNYISREALKAEIRRLSTHYLNEWDTLGVLAAADRIPAADVRPVVLCRDCYAYRRDKELAEAAYLDPEMYCGLLRCEMPEDGFCWYGKSNCGADMRPQPPKEE